MFQKKKERKKEKGGFGGSLPVARLGAQTRFHTTNSARRQSARAYCAALSLPFYSFLFLFLRDE